MYPSGPYLEGPDYCVLKGNWVNITNLGRGYSVTTQAKAKEAAGTSLCYHTKRPLKDRTLSGFNELL